MQRYQPQTATDHQLLELIRKDHRGAFTELYNRYWDKLFTVAMHRLNDEHEAEEVVQEVFLSLWQRRASVQLTHSINTYLSVAVKYRIINHLDKQYRKKQHIEHLTISSPLGEDSTNRWLSEKELRAQLEQSISQLPEKCRIVFLLSRDEHKTNAQIAAELNIAEKTVEAHMTKALSTLRQSLNLSVPILIYLLGK
ncbi:RNA polymerase sigma-70 factor [Mucilaginibacter sabulilitoris]|uniref:RNA polymerase sigma-70 factor n=1 Tax=Mucilaginibacter sabulilitoris TaxID=1173583 RepID=A0ABZ0TTA5_9SPHI|nr:RNA polymerase sigma-70 factor [Mucilaginibacter sabulilitoris]WPU96329.1 RNA polymerase sigma-70 factor [Mucilaginibacter sabulilitoris]